MIASIAAAESSYMDCIIPCISAMAMKSKSCAGLSAEEGVVKVKLSLPVYAARSKTLPP